MKPTIVTAILTIIVTFIWFFVTVDWQDYAFDASYSGFRFFVGEFPELISLISAEIVFFSFLIALNKLAISKRGVDQALYFQNYQLFKEVLISELNEFGALHLDRIRSPILFRELFSPQDNSKIENLKIFLETSSKNATDHRNTFREHARFLGFTIPDVGEQAFWPHEVEIIELINRIVDLMPKHLYANKKTIRLSRPDIIPPEY